MTMYFHNQFVTLHFVHIVVRTEKNVIHCLSIRKARAIYKAPLPLEHPQAFPVLSKAVNVFYHPAYRFQTTLEPFHLFFKLLALSLNYGEITQISQVS